MSLPFDWTYVVLVLAQAVLVALPRTGAVELPWLARLRSPGGWRGAVGSHVAGVKAGQPGALTRNQPAFTFD